MDSTTAVQLATDFVRRYFSDPAHQHSYETYFIQRNIRPRLIDYFVTRHCRDNNITLIRHNQVINIYYSYKQQLKSFHKKLFNLFSSAHQVTLQFANGTEYTHSVCYWNFIRWLIADGVVQYMMTIYNDMEKQYAARRRIAERPVPTDDGVCTPPLRDTAKSKKRGQREISAQPKRRINRCVSIYTHEQLPPSPPVDMLMNTSMFANEVAVA